MRTLLTAVIATLIVAGLLLSGCAKGASPSTAPASTSYRHESVQIDTTHLTRQCNRGQHPEERRFIRLLSVTGSRNKLVVHLRFDYQSPDSIPPTAIFAQAMELSDDYGNVVVRQGSWDDSDSTNLYLPKESGVCIHRAVFRNLPAGCSYEFQLLGGMPCPANGYPPRTRGEAIVTGRATYEEDRDE